MSYESELIAFLHEVADLRIKDISEQANQQADFIKINQASLAFMDSVTDENILAVLLNYEDLKNEYISSLMPYLYISGAKDSLMLYGMLSKLILYQD